MSTTAIDLLAPVHRITVEQYDQMVDGGVIDLGPRVALVDGVLVDMSPMGDSPVRELAARVEAAFVMRSKANEESDTSMTRSGPGFPGRYSYWIVNLRERVVEIHRAPVDGVYTEHTVASAGATLRPLLLPDVALELDDLLAFVDG